MSAEPCDDPPMSHEAMRASLDGDLEEVEAYAAITRIKIVQDGGAICLGKYYYQITVETKEGAEDYEIWRRFSDFEKLWDQLMAVPSVVKRPRLPDLPRKHMTKGGEHPVVVKERKAALQNLLDVIWACPKGSSTHLATRVFLDPRIDTRRDEYANMSSMQRAMKGREQWRALG